jgi:hypothetical protein
VASWTCSSVSPPLPSRHPGDVEQAQHGALAQVVVPLEPLGRLTALVVGDQLRDAVQSEPVLGPLSNSWGIGLNLRLASRGCLRQVFKSCLNA